jgi:N-acetylmuramoyl-L-alanine amidase
MLRRHFLQALGPAILCPSWMMSRGPAHARSADTHLAVREFGARYGLRVTQMTERAIKLSGAGHTLVFVPKTQQSQWNSTLIWLLAPVSAWRGSWGLLQSDVQMVMDPLLRPASHLRGVGRRVVALDPGHGGADEGARGRTHGLKEKDLALDIARRVRSKIANSGYRAVMTRETDRTMSLDERPRRARALGADLFVSIHLNAGPRTAAGVETFILTPRGFRSTAGGSVSTATYTAHRFNGANRILGHAIQRRLRVSAQTTDRGLRHARFSVLRDAHCPAVLVEGGFLSHARTEGLLRTSAYRDRIAQGIADGINDYLRGVAAAARG